MEIKKVFIAVEFKDGRLCQVLADTSIKKDALAFIAAHERDGHLRVLDKEIAEFKILDKKESA